MILGILDFPSHWFEDDDGENKTTRHFFYMDENGTIRDQNGHFRKKWLQVVRPVYNVPFSSNHDRDHSCFINWFDLKTNPRRIHPFCTLIVKWVQRLEHHHKTRSYPPLLILRPCSLLQPYHWRRVSERYGFSSCSFVYGYFSLCKLQKWWRRMIIRRRFHKVLFQIRDEVAFRPGKCGMMEACSRFDQKRKYLSSVVLKDG